MYDAVAVFVLVQNQKYPPLDYQFMEILNVQGMQNVFAFA